MQAFGASFAFDWGAALTAPINEELAKGAGVLLLLVLAPRLVRSPFDGLILGGCSQPRPISRVRSLATMVPRPRRFRVPA